MYNLCLTAKNTKPAMLSACFLVISAFRYPSIVFELKNKVSSISVVVCSLLISCKTSTSLSVSPFPQSPSEFFKSRFDIPWSIALETSSQNKIRILLLYKLPSPPPSDRYF
ncbi:MAG: hypothetical protein ACI840_000468 [Ulvibacter sp.]|jgi:hypothetical protein